MDIENGGETQQDGFCTTRRACGGCCGFCIAYLLLNFGPLLLIATSDLAPAADASVPGAKLIMDKALEELKARKLEMTISIIEPEGEVIGRAMSAGASTTTYSAAFYKFRFLQTNSPQWDTEKVCAADASLCIRSQLLIIGIRRVFSCPGAVVLYKDDKVIGVAAMSGGAPAEDDEVVTAAVLAAGYVKRRDTKAQFDYEGLGGNGTNIFAESESALEF